MGSSELNPREFRQTVGQFATGVTVIAMEVEGEVRAMTANSFTSLSLDPPLVLFCVAKETRTGRVVHSIDGFAISILREEQQDLSSFFAGVWKQPTPPRFRFIEWTGGPRLEGCTAAIGCRVHAIHEGGDHWIVVGQALALYRADEPSRPLVFLRGRYVPVKDAGSYADDLSLMIAWSGPLG